MHKLNFSIDINAPIEKVWSTMLDLDTYKQWTSAFNPGGSYYEGSWDQGAEIKFLGPDQDGKLGGMLGKIKENRENEYICIEYWGIMVNGEVDIQSEEVKKWQGSTESYTFSKIENGTHLEINIEVTDELKDMFGDLWPKGLKALKDLCE